MDDLRLTVGDEDRELADRLDHEIYAFNVESTGLDDGRMLTVRVEDDAGELVAGLSGWTWGGCGYVDVLWVRGDHRGRGLGTRLMDVAEAEVAARGCRQVVLSSHSFQAPAFYRARGYHETGRTDGYPLGHAQVHLAKRLPAGPSTG
jgi:GNAT superfamily N-acetyltransferase